MILVVDIGNSYLKMASWDGRRLSAQERVRHRELLDADWQASLEKHVKMKSDGVFIASVADPGVNQNFEAWLRSHGHEQPTYLQSTHEAHGMRNAYAEPQTLGVDRWCAMIAAHDLHEGAVCVVDVGTALTVDWVDGTGQHRGGLIMPGPSLQSESLFAGTSQVQGGTHDVPGLFANNTADAVNAGTRYSCATLIEFAIEEIAKDAGEAPKTFLTGGEARRIEPLMKTQVDVREDLVLRGVACLVEESRG